VQRFRDGLVFRAHKLCVSLNSRLESNKEEKRRPVPAFGVRVSVSVESAEFWAEGTEFVVSGFGFRDSGFGIGDSGSGIRDSGFGIRVPGLGFRDWRPPPGSKEAIRLRLPVPAFGFRVSVSVEGAEIRANGTEFVVSDSGFRVSGFGFQGSGLGIGD